MRNGETVKIPTLDLLVVYVSLSSLGGNIDDDTDVSLVLLKRNLEIQTLRW